MADIKQQQKIYDDAAARTQKFIEDRATFENALKDTLAKKIDNYAPLEAAKNKALAKAQTVYLTSPQDLEGTSFDVKYNTLAQRVANAMSNFYTANDTVANAKGTIGDLVNQGIGLYNDKAQLQGNQTSMAYQTLQDMIKEKQYQDELTENNRRYNQEWAYKLAQDALTTKTSGGGGGITNYPSRFPGTNNNVQTTENTLGGFVWEDEATGNAYYVDKKTGKITPMDGTGATVNRQQPNITTQPQTNNTAPTQSEKILELQNGRYTSKPNYGNNVVDFPTSNPNQSTAMSYTPVPKYSNKAGKMAIGTNPDGSIRYAS